MGIFGKRETLTLRSLPSDAQNFENNFPACATEDKEGAESLRMRAEELRRLTEQASAAAEETAGTEAAPEEPASGAGNSREEFGLGEVVWAKEKGWPSWPAIVITYESSRDLSSLSESLRRLTPANQGRTVRKRTHDSLSGHALLCIVSPE